MYIYLMYYKIQTRSEPAASLNIHLIYIVFVKLMLPI